MTLLTKISFSIVVVCCILSIAQRLADFDKDRKFDMLRAEVNQIETNLTVLTAFTTNVTEFTHLQKEFNAEVIKRLR